MGNNLVPAFFKAPTPTTRKIPTSLMDLLTSLPLTNDKDAQEGPLNKDNYLTKFKEYLKTRNLSEEENILSFMISYSVFLRKSEELVSNKPKKTSQQIAVLKKQKKELFIDICENYFNYENPDNLIALNSEVLMDELNNSLELRKSPQEPNYSLLERVVEDNSVKDIETTFEQFMRQMGQKRTACILSLL